MDGMVRMTLGVATALALTASTAGAQLSNMPVYANPAVSAVRIQGDYAFGVNQGSGEHSAFAARGNLVVSKLILGAGVGVVKLTDTEPMYMGSLGYRLLGGGAMPLAVALQAGVGVVETANLQTTVDVPVSLGVALHLPLVLVTIDPWIAPRYTLQFNSIAGTTGSRNHLGLSAGIDARLAMGLGFQLGLDWQRLPDFSLDAGIAGIVSDAKREPFLMSLGIHFAL
jgi:hypothetical protein